MIIKLEKYFVILNGNSELLRMNDELKKTGYEFIKIMASDLEGKGEFLKIKPKHRKEDADYLGTLYGSVGVEMGAVFDEDNSEIILLKEKSKRWKFVDEKDGFASRTEVDENNNKIEFELLNFFINPEEKIISKVNLFLDGDIYSIFMLTINADKRELFAYKMVENHNTFSYKVEVVIEKFQPFEHIISKDYKYPDMLDLAVSAYDEFHDIKNRKLAYVNMIMGLESIFNRSSSDPIQHIISRHAALLLSRDEKQFNRIYKRIKELYSIRSSIVHGESNKNKLKKIESEFPQSIIDARHLLKRVLRELLWQSFTTNSALNKDELFNKLNEKGI